MTPLSRKPTFATGDSRCRNYGSRGFTLVELVTVVSIMLIIGSFSAPLVINAVHGARLRGATSDLSSLLEVARMSSIKADTYKYTYFLAGTPVEVYVDLQGDNKDDLGDPDILMSKEVATIAATSAPNTANLKGQFLPAGSALAVNDGLAAGTPIVFSPRGLPCTSQTASVAGGGSSTVCDSAGGATAFWVFLQNNLSLAWTAVTVSPAGRIRKWQYVGGNWTPM